MVVAVSGRRLLAAVALAVLVGLSAGCTGQAAPPPTWSGPTVYIEVPTRTETVPAPPVASATTATPTPDQTLYDQAVEVYHQFYEQDVKLQLAGGADALPPEMAELLTDTALLLLEAGYAAIKKDGYHLVGDPQFEVVWIRPYTGDLLEGTVVALETCEEMDGARWQSGDGTHTDRWDHYLSSHRYFFRHNDQQRLVMFGVNGEAVEACPA